MSLFFKNPLLEKGPDPWMYKHTNGKYLFTVTLVDRIDLWESDSMTRIAEGKRKTIWTPPSSGHGSKEIWAPEIHYINESWYVYFTASDGSGDTSRRVYVLQNNSQNPMEGQWIERGAINTKVPGLDGTVFQHNGSLYFLYAGYGYFPDYGSAIYIARMLNPWTLEGEETLLTKPEFEWERQGGIAINEGPVVLKRNGRLFLVYSASATWSEDYSLGMLTASDESDVMAVASWKKSLAPVFKKSHENGVYAPGHNSFTKSPDDTEDWIVYHAISENTGPCLDTTKRNVRIQKFNWHGDGSPDFGIPLSVGREIAIPSGEAPGKAAIC